MSRVYYKRIILIAIFLFYIAGCSDDKKRLDTEPVSDDPVKTEKIPFDEATDEPEFGDSEFISATGPKEDNYGEDYDNESNNARTGNNSTENSGSEADSEAAIEEADIYKMYGDDVLLNLNSYKGFQVIDLSNIEQPEIIASIQVTGQPVEIYVIDQVAYVLVSGYSTYYYEISRFAPTQFIGSLVMAVDISDLHNPRILSKLPVEGTINTSRIVTKDNISTLYVISNHYNDRNEYDEMNIQDNADFSDNVPRGWSSYVTNYNISNPELIDEIDSLRLDGSTQSRIVYASPETLVVPIEEYIRGEGRKTRLSIIDISELRDEIEVSLEFTVDGRVQNKFNMDIYNNLLRVVSHYDRWNFENNTFDEGSNLSSVYTFNISEPSNSALERLLDKKTFGGFEDLYATIFVENKAFFVTYLRSDPFHAFEIKDDGSIIEHNEFFISGWNNFFKVIDNKQRLMGVGVNDDNGNRNLAVSLYDITHLSPLQNEEPETDINDLSCGRWPCIDREQMDSESSYSEAQWDERAFTVLENAISVRGDSGEETGLILIPFSIWSLNMDEACDNNDEECIYDDIFTTGVQIFTFNNNNITKRGRLNHTSEVRRSFLAANHIASLSEKTLSLFDFSDINNLEHVSDLSLAPNVSSFFIFGDYGVRINRVSDDNMRHARKNCNVTHALIQVVDLENGKPVDGVLDFELKCEFYGEFIKSGNLLVNILHEDNYEDTDTKITVYDFSNPELPVIKKILTTDKVLKNNKYYDECWDCYENNISNSMNMDSGMNSDMNGEMSENGMGMNSQALAVAEGWAKESEYDIASLADSIVFTVEKLKTRQSGTRIRCEYNPTGGYEDYSDCYGNYGNNTGTNIDSNSDFSNNSSNGESNSWSNSEANSAANSMNYDDEMPPTDAGHDTCWYSDYLCEGEGADTTCKQCKYYANGHEECINLEIEERCYEEDVIEKYRVIDIEILKLENPENPVFAETIEFSKDKNMDLDSIISDEKSIYVNYSIPVEVEDSNLSFSRYYFQAVDLSNPEQPEFGPEINIPGRLRMLDGNKIVTENFSWLEPSNYNSSTLTHSLVVLELQEDLAVIKAIKTFIEDETMETVFINDEYAYVIQKERYYSYWENNSAGAGRNFNSGASMTIIELDNPDLEEVSKIELDHKSYLKMASHEKAFFSLPDGLLIVDLEDIENPEAQAYLSLKGWPESIVVNSDKVYVSAGEYGLYVENLDLRNLEER